MYYSAKDQKKVRVWNERVYTHKGYIEIKGNGVVDIASLGGVAHQNACGLALVDAGFRVSGPPDTIKWIEKNRTSKTLAERN